MVILSKPKVDFESALKVLQTRGTPELIAPYVLSVYQYPDATAVTDSIVTLYSSNTISLNILSVLLMLPLIAAAVLWLYDLYKHQKDFIGKVIVAFFPLSFLGIVINIALNNCDWGRLFIQYGICCFFSFIVLYSVDEEGASHASDYVLSKMKIVIRFNSCELISLFYLTLSMLFPPTTNLLFNLNPLLTILS